MRNATQKLSLSALAAVLCALSVGADSAPSPEAGVMDGNTRPSMEAKVAFTIPGLVSEVNVNVGDYVKVGQIMARQDDRQDVAELQRIQMEADSTAKIENYIADQAIKQVQLDRMTKLEKESHAAAPSEVEAAELDVELAKTQVALAKLDHDQKKLDAEKQKIKIDLMQLASPINGVVEVRNINPGEVAAADPQNHEGSIVVVQNDPLWIETNVPTAAGMQLKLGDVLKVKYDWEKEWQPAKIIAFSPKADAKSDTQMVRLEMANPSNVRSGVHMQVKLPENIAAMAAAEANNP